MATIGELNKLKMQIKRLSSIRDMKALKLNDYGSKEALKDFYTAYDKLDDKLSEYFAASIMFMKVNKPELYDVYIELSKETVKFRMLRQITKEKKSDLSHKFVIDRINKLNKEQREIKDKTTPRAKAKIRRIKNTLIRLEAWAKDLNYEIKRDKNICYKPPI